MNDHPDHLSILRIRLFLLWIISLFLISPITYCILHLFNNPLLSPATLLSNPPTNGTNWSEILAPKVGVFSLLIIIIIVVVSRIVIVIVVIVPRHPYTNNCTNDDEKDYNNAQTNPLIPTSVPRVLFGNHKFHVSSHKFFMCLFNTLFDFGNHRFRSLNFPCHILEKSKQLYQCSLNALNLCVTSLDSPKCRLSSGGPG